MDDIERIDVAKDYIANHLNNDVFKWQPAILTGDAKYMAIYNSLIRGLLGEISCVNLDKNKFEIEIPPKESHSGKHLFFWWYDEDFNKQ